MARLRAPFTEWPPMAALGHAGDEALASRFARAMARELAAVGITFDFAPVLDVNNNPANPVIAERSFGADPHEVANVAGEATVDLMNCRRLREWVENTRIAGMWDSVDFKP